MTRVARLTLVLAAALLAAVVAPASAMDVEGLTLPDAIAAFREAGLDVLYSSALVTDGQVVARAPASDSPVDALAEILEPHGLALQPGPENLLIVVRAGPVSDPAPAGSLFGVVKLAGTGDRIANADVLLQGAARRRVVTGSAGEFSFHGLRPGNYELTVRDSLQHRVGGSVATVENGRTSVVIIALNGDDPLPLGSIVVNASQWQLFDALDVAAPSVLERDQMLSLPKLGDDVMRTVNTLPGTAFGGLTARPNIRGGDTDEVLLRFDGLRLYDPFHLKDFQSITSIVDGRATSALEVYTGGFPARYGERMSGVVDIRSLEPLDERHTEIGFSFFNSSLLTSGLAGDGAIEWLASVRRGNTDLFVERVNPRLGDPVYFDAVGKLGFRVNDSLKVTASVLTLRDNIELSDSDAEETASADYDDAYYWLTLEHVAGRASGRTIVSRTVLDSEREGVIDNDSLAAGFLRDRQHHEISGLQTDWRLPFGDRLSVDVGAEYRRMRGDYRFNNEVAYALQVVGAASDVPARSSGIDLRPRGESLAVYGSVKWQPFPALVTETGARWSRDTLNPRHDSTFSPRLSALYRLSDRTRLRAGWGRFYQPQRIDELKVADGERTYAPAQRAEHIILGLEHRFEAGPKLRVEAYRKTMGSLRARYENLFNTFVVLPELQPDRTRIAPDTAVAEGIEIHLSRSQPDNVHWWFSYAWSSAKDETDGVQRPRSWDQTHAANAGITWHGQRWDVSLSTSYHSGWPFTPVEFDSDARTDRPLLVPDDRNSGDLSPFHTVDVRATRRFDLGGARLSLFAEASNVFGRNNPCCADYDIEDEDDLPVLEQDPVYWLGFTPSLGFLVEF